MPPFLLASRLGYTADLGATVLYALFVVLWAWLLWLTLRGKGYHAKVNQAKKEGMLGADEWMILVMLLLCFVLATLYLVSFLTGYFPSFHP
jgi:hypothetical protein